LMLADHLRLRRELGVDRKQRVEDAVTVVAGDVGGGPDRVEDAQIRLCDEFQRLPVIRRLGAVAWQRGGERAGGGRPSGALAEVAAGQTIAHYCLPKLASCRDRIARMGPQPISAVATSPSLLCHLRMHLDDFDFALPRELIADRPAEPREAARLLVL